ncbi:hypothetical protein D3C71_609110 [compost metagenome]
MFREDLTSKKTNDLKKMIGCKIKSIIHCSQDTFDSFNEEELYNISQNEFFKYASGPVVFVLEDLEVGFTSNEKLNSIVTWTESNGLLRSEDYFRNDSDFLLIENSNKEFTGEREQSLSGQIISSIQILRFPPPTTNYEGLPNEMGVCIRFENNNHIVMSHKLIDSPDSFCVTYLDEINPEKLELSTISSII